MELLFLINKLQIVEHFLQDILSLEKFLQLAENGLNMRRGMVDLFRTVFFLR